MIDIAIIGGGISGLAVAYAVKRQGRRVLVLERQVRPGGSAISERFDGFLMEHGPSAVVAGSNVLSELSRELGLDVEKCDLSDEAGRRYLIGGGRLHGIPAHPLAIFTSSYLSRAARLRLLAEPMVRRCDSNSSESIARFCRRRFGSEFTERVIDPLVGGIYGGRAEELSVAAVFPKLVDLERRYGSIALGALRSHLAGERMPGTRQSSWRDGIETLPRALKRELEGSLRTGVVARQIERCAVGFRIDAGEAGSFTARSVVVATQPHIAAGLLEDVDASAADAAGGIAAPPLAVAFLGYRRDQVAHPLDGIGFLVPQGEGRSLTGAQFCSTMFPGRAPAGAVAIAGYIGGSRAPELARLSTDDLIALASEEFSDLIGTRGEPLVARVRHWPAGLPQYHCGHGDRVAALEGLSDSVPGLFVTGNYFSGPSVAECLDRAQITANTTLDYLARLAPGVGRHTESGTD